MQQVIHPKSIVILDFGGQYAHLIARRVRECGAFSQILSPETPIDLLRQASGIILSGGPQSVYEKGSATASKEIFTLGIPILGICYGHQWIAHMCGGSVAPGGATKEYGFARVMRNGESPIFASVSRAFTAWMSHSDTVKDVPPGFSILAATSDCPVAAMGDDAHRIYAVQFHLEVVHTEHGSTILKNFVDLCDHAPWSMSNYSQRIGSEVRSTVGDRHVFMLVSGGVDSTVAFTVLNESLGPARVQGLLIDTGLMRKNEVKNVTDAFDVLGFDNLRVVDASAEFFKALQGLTEPEAKRKAIGETFLAVQKRVSEEMGLSMDDGWMLGQGTIYPDTIETGGTHHSDTIKTHHNRIPAVQKLIEKGLVIEPLKDLYKDEVRRLGEEFRLPHDLVWRHPFPGPGLGVRILCGEHPEAVSPTIPECPLPHVVLPVQSVGVQGDSRTYRHAVSVFLEHPSLVTDQLRDLARSIPNKNPSINRVLLCTSHVAPQTFLFTPGTITPERAHLLQEADFIVNEELHRAKRYDAIWQFPVVLLPLGIQPGGQSIVLRPIDSVDAMTADAVVLPSDVLKRMTERILALPGIDAVFLDLTSKPPATIEWE